MCSILGPPEVNTGGDIEQNAYRIYLEKRVERVRREPAQEETRGVTGGERATGHRTKNEIWFSCGESFRERKVRAVHFFACRQKYFRLRQVSYVFHWPKYL